MGIEIIILLIEVEFLPYGIVSGYIIYKGTRYIRTMKRSTETKDGIIHLSVKSSIISVLI